MYKCLYTNNLRYDSVIRSETSRRTLLTILLKLIINLEKLEKEKQIQPLEQQQVPICQMLETQFPDPCPENRIQCCKCIFRYSRAYKYLLTDQQITSLSEVIIKNFNHQRSQVRELSLQAFVQLHLCVQSKEIYRYWGPLMNFMLNDDQHLEPLIEASRTLLTEHVDRHVFADYFVIPFIANLQDAWVFEEFEKIGQFYAEENRKYDKFIRLQKEMEETNEAQREEAQRYDEFIREFNEKYFKDSAFTHQMCAGCRILGQKCLDRNRKAILADMRAVNSAQTRKLACLMCNLLLLTENYCAAFSSDLLENLGTMLHDTFHSREYQKVIHLIARFAPVSDVLALLRAQFGGN